MADKIITYNGQIVTVANKALSIQEETSDTSLKCYFVRMMLQGTCSNSSWGVPKIEGNFVVFTTNTYTAGANASANLSRMQATLHGTSHFIAVEYAIAYNGYTVQNAVSIKGLGLTANSWSFYPSETCSTVYITPSNISADRFDVTQL